MSSRCFPEINSQVGLVLEFSRHYSQLYPAGHPLVLDSESPLAKHSLQGDLCIVFVKFGHYSSE